jgi:GNAT superfamily N-acetyltransferase
MHSIRLAEATDVDAIIALHQVPRHNSDRAPFIRRSIAGKGCYVAIDEGLPIGYAVLEYSFYDNGFISVVYLDAKYRRKGIGEELMRHLERVCRTPKIFTSTNQSNTAMQSLLAKLDYLPSGVIHNLDEGDPELVYYKRLNRRQ